MIAHLPRVNALLNLSSALLLAGGFYFIKRQMVDLHRACMVAAFVVSTAFLISYLTYHAHVGHVPYKGQGNLRTIYFTILTTHTILAAAIQQCSSARPNSAGRSANSRCARAFAANRSFSRQSRHSDASSLAAALESPAATLGPVS